MTLRFHALQNAASRHPVKAARPASKPTDYFGCNVFDLNKMQKYLSKNAYNAVVQAKESGGKVDHAMADEIAMGMKEWALQMGATHYAHWFQPLTGATAEKHDSFLDLDHENNRVIEQFSGSLLVQQEPDASSFPSGGIRTTFEARGYTAWDPASPAFLIDSTLCIPSIFISYTGESLDYKTPLLKANALLNKAAAEVCRYFDDNVKRVTSTLGWEQEYFVVDSALYEARPDLILTGRTLLGEAAAKDQQLEDHYFGSIPERVAAYIEDIEIEAYKLGIPAKTRHNEVAPNQFELAPVFEEVDIAVDHNILIMDVMRRVAKKHNFTVLLHEKPFAGINGSGKHNNWSMATDTGVNLLQPSSDPKRSLQFLCFLTNVVKAVHDNADLLLASIASTGNEHRLGANEAPPAIISVFLGTQLTALLDAIENKVADRGVLSEAEKTFLELNIERIPEITLHNTDRNRTSPFAFTGNKFEFRAVGSSANCASAMLTLSSVVAAQLLEFKSDVDALIASGLDRESALFNVIHKYTVAAKNIRFDGNNYSREWEEEAARRGIPNLKTAPEAWAAFTSAKAEKVFVKSGIFTHRELEARHEVLLEAYVKKIVIEAKVLADLAKNHVLPTAIKYQNQLIEYARGMKDVLGADAAKASKAMLTEINTHITGITTGLSNLNETLHALAGLESTHAKAHLCADEMKKLLSAMRADADALEGIVDNEIWPLPKYRELLFIR